MDSLFWERDYDFQGIENWMVCNVTTMRRLFAGNYDKPSKFNGNISGWNVSNVTDMSSMFYLCSAFNQDLSKWDVKKVTSCLSIFSGATEMEKTENESKWPNFTKYGSN